MKKFIVLLCIVLLSVGVCFGEACHFELDGDVDGNCKIDMVDFAIMAQGWLVDCHDTPDDPRCIPLDIDEDGFDATVDCDDNDPTIYPGAPDLAYDGIDQNCDGSNLMGPEEPDGMVFVTINDPGVSDHEGFDGEMSKYETTNAQYCQFLNAALASEDIYVSYNRVYGSDGFNLGADFVDESYFETYEYSSQSQITYDGSIFRVRIRDGYDMSNHPVIEVSWYGARAFCNYYGYRLPTEWEWQAVADYDGSYIYGCGITIDQDKANYDYANPLGLLSIPKTSPVDHYPSYGYGMNDMAGNVWEWTDSIYSGSYRIIRGGGWTNIGSYCSVSRSDDYNSDTSNSLIGFRMCR